MALIASAIEMSPLISSSLIKIAMTLFCSSSLFRIVRDLVGVAGERDDRGRGGVESLQQLENLFSRHRRHIDAKSFGVRQERRIGHGLVERSAQRLRTIGRKIGR